jgi:hypothetical protein
MADHISSAAGTDCSSGFELETRSSATNHDDSGGGWSVSVGALRQESLVRTAGVQPLGEDLLKNALRVWGCELRTRWQTYPLAANRCIRAAG